MAPLIEVLVALAFCLAALTPTNAATTCASSKRAEGPPLVTVRNGTYVGIHSEQYNQDFFLGMPYAQRPTRFAVSQPLNSTWTGSRNATAYPPHCVGFGGDEVGYPLSEDCLYLNVIRPAGITPTAGLPVAVWIHGGGLVMGGSADRRYNLSFIVRNSVSAGTPLLGVSLNYRLSAFGFVGGREVAAAGATNIGFRDQRLALRWVRENVAAFGGDPAKVTIWGESSGAESVSAHVLAYGGRDNETLFRAAAAESGFGNVLPRFPGGLDARAAVQNAYDQLVNATSCRNSSSTASLSCLSALPLADLVAALNGTGVLNGSPGSPAPGPWPPVIDGGFLQDHPAAQLRDGRFARVPLLLGANSDEGAAFGAQAGSVDNDTQMADAVRRIIGPNAANNTGRSVEQLVRELLYLYPDVQAVGIPSLDKFPVIKPGDEVAKQKGLQYRRTSALFGDYVMHYARRRSNLAWAKYGVPSYSYRFDVTVNGVPDYVAATHFQEVAFVFDNENGDGYATNPFANKTPSYSALAKTMSAAWINFFVRLDPNGGSGLGAAWPNYDPAAGGGVGQNLVFTVDGPSYVELDSWRTEGIKWMVDNGQAVFGS